MAAVDAFARNLRGERRAAGLSQEALASATGLHPSEISRLERGVRDPRLTTIVRLASGLSVSTARLVEGTD